MGDVQIDEVDKEHGVDFVDELFDGIEIVTSDGDINVASGMSFMPSLRTEQPCLRLMIAANRRHSSDGLIDRRENGCGAHGDIAILVQTRSKRKSRAETRLTGLLVRPVGIEPTTYGLEVRCSIH